MVCSDFSFNTVSVRITVVHHVIPQSFGQLLMSLYGEVEAVMSEEGHINLPILFRGIKHVLFKVSNKLFYESESQASISKAF